MSSVTVVRTGAANLASVLAGLRRCGVAAEVTGDRETIAAAERLVLPGVGAFGAVMDALRGQQLVDILRERIQAARPTLTICLGLQVLAQASDESPGTEGLGIFNARVERFPDTVRVPQLGWNFVEAAPGMMFESGYAYYANSYRIVEAPEGWSSAFTDHAGRFVAAVERGAVLACQFHPELSGAWGRGVMERWLARSAGRVTSC